MKSRLGILNRQSCTTRSIYHNDDYCVLTHPWSYLAGLHCVILHRLQYDLQFYTYSTVILQRSASWTFNDGTFTNVHHALTICIGTFIHQRSSCPCPDMVQQLLLFVPNNDGTWIHQLSAWFSKSCLMLTWSRNNGSVHDSHKITPQHELEINKIDHAREAKCAGQTSWLSRTPCKNHIETWYNCNYFMTKVLMGCEQYRLSFMC